MAEPRTQESINFPMPCPWLPSSTPNWATKMQGTSDALPDLSPNGPSKKILYNWTLDATKEVKPTISSPE